MSIAQQICYNGEYFQENIPILTNRNRAFKYGDSLFETIHANGTRLQFFEDHFIRLQKGMNTLKMIANSDFNPITIEKEIIRLLNKNKLYQGARIRLSIFRKDGGFYTPINNQIDYLIEATALELDCYKLNQKGLRIGLFADISKSINCLSNLKTSNALLYTLAGIYKTENNFDDLLITNDQGRICEAISSNIFIVKNEEIYTPSIEEGCVEGIMRKQIINIAQKNNLSINYNAKLTKQDLLTADELFFSNTINAISWVVAYEEQRYFNKIARFLISELNRIAF